MASTSTNKQPLLVDRVLYATVRADRDNLISGIASPSIDLGGTNTSAPLVDCTQNDGALIEDMFVISRSGANTYKALFYLSTANDFLRPAQADFVGDITSSATIGAFTSVYKLPKVLAPAPHVLVPSDQNADRPDQPAKNEAFYIPRGKALWVTIQGTTAANDAPIIGCQGGFY